MDYPMYIQSLKQKEFLLQLAQEKSQIFIREFANFAIREFQKQVYFVGSRSCPNRTKLGMEYPMCTQSGKQKKILLQLAQEKSQIFIREFANFAIREFQKQVYFVGSRSCSNRTKLGMEYHMCIQSLKQKEFLLQLAQEKS